MSKDPAYLAALGELATLKNAIGAWFHQDAYLDFASDEDIWADMFAGHDAEARQLLIAQIVALLQRSDDAIIDLWNSQAHSHEFANGDEARHFFRSMLEYFYSRGRAAQHLLKPGRFASRRCG